MSDQYWVPFESNPETMNKFLANVGVPTDEWAIVDVIGLDEELLAFMDSPVIALILLFPTNVVKTGEEVEGQKGSDDSDKSVYFMHQTITNMCGTIALIHSVANNESSDRIQLKSNSSLKAFLDSSRGLTPEERGKLLESNADICGAHKTFAKDGQTAAPDDGSTSDKHFVALVQNNGILYELDGRRANGPKNHGKTSDEKFLSDAARVCRQYLARDPNNLNFSVLALSRQNQN